MIASKQKLNVFVSSTSKDLQSYRAVARLAVLDMGWTPVMMEHFGALPDSTVAACEQKLSECDLMLLVVAFNRGWVPAHEQGGDGVKSITAWELDFARSKNIPVLVMLANEASWPGRLYENDQSARDWIANFRAQINLPAVFFDFEQEILNAGETERFPSFRAKLRDVLLNHKERLLEREKAAETLEIGAGLDHFESARDGILAGTTIPFIGSGVYEGGPLSTEALAKTLSRDSEENQFCLATAAEYRERRLRTRELFLDELGRIIEAQSRALNGLPPIYRVLQEATPPPLIISTTYDLVLERCLEEKGKTYVLVCHVVRSFRGQEDGKILVFRNKKPEICLADKTDVRGCDFVIYKPLGSPLLHGLTDPDAEIDTVVITETDHLLFLSRLEHESTQIPSAFSRLLQRRPLLFAGYGLDVWQYRLVTQVFHLIGAEARSMAVRKPASSMEELAWSCLGTDLIRLDTGAFGQRALSDLIPIGRSAYGD